MCLWLDAPLLIKFLELCAQMHWLKFNLFLVGQYIPLFILIFLTWCNFYFFFFQFFFVHTDWSLSRSSWPLNLSCVPQMPCSSLPFSCLTRPAQEASHLVTCVSVHTKACMLRRRCMPSSTAGGRASCNDNALISKTTVLGWIYMHMIFMSFSRIHRHVLFC